MMKCLNKKVRDPYSLLGSEWIRPEDIKYFEEMCNKTRNHNFYIRLLERTKNTEFLRRVIMAYATRSYDSNLLDIVSWIRNSEVAKLHKIPFGIQMVKEGYNMKEVDKYLDMLDLSEIYVGNKKLDGFLEKFIKNNQCDKKICTSIDKIKLENEDSKLYCAYCSSWLLFD